MNILGSDEIPIGFGMALAANSGAMQYFSSLDDNKRRQILSRAKNIESKQEMQGFVNSMQKDSFF